MCRCGETRTRTLLWIAQKHTVETPESMLLGSLETPLKLVAGVAENRLRVPSNTVQVPLKTLREAPKPFLVTDLRKKTSKLHLREQKINTFRSRPIADTPHRGRSGAE